MEHRLCSLLLVLLVSVLVSGESNIVISLGQGQQLRGINTTSSDGHIVYKFHGIRYALPPTGNRRFRPPEPEPDWTGVKDALKIGDICPQGTNKDLTEDCLYLNVFTSDPKGSLPVFVWIHGGRYQVGSAFKDGDGATLAPHGIVAVTINYRLGPFGYFSTGDDVMPGNYGNLDQILALKWVQKNIRAFGGNPAQVTIAGASAGAFSVSLLIGSPLGKGLFHRAIIQSGSALSLTAVERPGNKVKVKEATLRSAARLGCDKSTSTEVLQCLQKVDAVQIMNVTGDAVTIPRVETTFGFLPDDPLNLLKGGNYNKVDTLHGTNSGEWSETIVDSKNNGVTKQEFTDTVRATLASFINVDEMTRLVTDAYIGNKTDPFVLRETLVQAVADLHYGGATITEERQYQSDPNIKKNHFMYEFDYRYSATTTPEWQGVHHTAERRFVFYPDTRYRYPAADDKAVGEAVQAMWVNFVKTGDPTPPTNMHTASGKSLVNWSQFTNNSPHILKIDAHSTVAPYPRPFLIPLYENILEIMKSEARVPIVG